MARRTGPTPATVKLLENRAAGLCEICGFAECQQIHHRKPRGMGGTRDAAINSASNLCWICHPCHARVESDRAQAKLDGHIVPNCGDSALVPFKYRGTMRLLTDEGEAIKISESA